MKPWNLKKQNDWTGVELIDPNTNETHATIDSATPEALALIAAAPALLWVARFALADLEGVMPEFEPSGERSHPGWETIQDLKSAIAKAEGMGE